MPDKESQSIEFKSNWRDEYFKVISSFANCEGGMLKIGVDDRGNPIGLKNTDRLLEDLPNKIRNKLGIIPSIEVEKKNKREIIRISVHPSFVPISYDGKFFIRSGSTVQELQGKELADFLMKKSFYRWDDAIEERMSLSEIDADSIEQFKRYAVDRIPAITKETDLVRLLQKLNLIENNQLKRAAVLLFGKAPQQFYRQAVVRIGKFLTETEVQSTDIVKGNLFQQLENTLEILRMKYLKSITKFEGIHRRDILEYPYEALREAVINALIHRDYLGTSQIQVRVYSDKLVIMNQGKLPPEISVEELKTSHLSIPRNTLLAEVFYYAGFIESWGRGTIKIVENCVAQGLPEPDFAEENGVMSVVFYKDVWTAKNLKQLGLNERQIKAVMYVKEKGFINNSKYQEINNIGKTIATEELHKLVEKGVLTEPTAKGRGAKYELKN